MHSNLLQIALERGVPALILWLAFLYILRPHALALLRKEGNLEWIERGILLGALGGLAGFFTSGLVHYNWGDSEVVMVFYMIMGLALAVNRNSSSHATSTNTDSEQKNSRQKTKTVEHAKGRSVRLTFVTKMTGASEGRLVKTREAF